MNHKRLDDFFSLLRFPSISTDENYSGKLNGCAEWLVRKLRNIGLDAESAQTNNSLGCEKSAMRWLPDIRFGCEGFPSVR
jgi:acetylornithine deacetylase/succinyl-diaminopimelate desuccinylase-like protein